MTLASLVNKMATLLFFTWIQWLGILSHDRVYLGFHHRAGKALPLQLFLLLVCSSDAIILAHRFSIFSSEGSVQVIFTHCLVFIYPL